MERRNFNVKGSGLDVKDLDASALDDDGKTFTYSYLNYSKFSNLDLWSINFQIVCTIRNFFNDKNCAICHAETILTKIIQTNISSLLSTLYWLEMKNSFLIDLEKCSNKFYN